MFSSDEFANYESIVCQRDPKTGLRAIFCIHSTKLGPAAGGTRMWYYESEEDALTDALRLAKGMTYKNALAGLPLGGAKAVIMNNQTRKDEDFYKTYGAWINQLEGKFLTAEDVGMNMHDMDSLQKYTPFVFGGTKSMKSSGDPSNYTALGVLIGMEVAVKRVLNKEMNEITCVIQGLGSVGMYLSQLLLERGAHVIATDISEERKTLASSMGVTIVPPESIYAIECDVFAPCALGATINPSTIPLLRTKIVAGCANNQLLDEASGRMLFERGIVYVPDYALNAGGVIHVGCEILRLSQMEEKERISGIAYTIDKILECSFRENVSSHLIANRLAEERLALPQMRGHFSQD